MLKEIENDVRSLGFDLREFGPNTFAIQGIPSDIEEGKEKEILETIVEQYKRNSATPSTGIPEILSRSLARSIAIRKNNILRDDEMKMILNELHNCEKSERGLDGKPCMILLKTGDLADILR